MSCSAVAMAGASNSEQLAQRLGISRAAAELYLASEVVDLHIESFSFTRSFGYDLGRRHSGRWNRALLFGQADFPRLDEARVSGAIWSITANPLRPAEDRRAAFAQQLGELKTAIAGAGVALARSLSGYQAARARGKQVAFLGIQGASALAPEPEHLEEVAGELIKVCLLHLTSTALGTTSTFSGWPRLPWRTPPGLSDLGADFVRVLNERRVLVDLAHVHPQTFWEAFRLADPSVPLIVSHTGVRGVHQHWRNLDDDQLRAVRERGGTVGIIYHAEFLGDGLLRGRVATVARHIRHALEVAGPDHVSLGSDWDGLICTPRDMPTCLELPRLVDELLRQGVPEQTVVKVLGQNFLRVLGELGREEGSS